LKYGHQCQECEDAGEEVDYETINDQLVAVYLLEFGKGAASCNDAVLDEGGVVHLFY